MTQARKTKAEELAAMMSAMMGDREDGPSEELTTEQKLAVLRDFSEKYSTPAARRFKAGDLVTPSDRSCYKWNGEPHIVLEVRDRGEAGAAIDTALNPGQDRVTVGSNSYGQRLDLRVASINGRDGELGSHWVEAFMFEPWTAPVAKAA